ncbi:MAG TPA: hypothetical protein VJ878_01140, partial [Candidatus Izemoplasmatales bacterium]|nr:hypothetical protein [Candidatus Izemoplasmatales bacterium]
MNNKNKLYSEISQYKEEIEIKYLVRQNSFVLTLISIVGILTLVYLFLYDRNMRVIYGIAAGYLVILAFNIASLSYGKIRVEFLRFNKFITAISFFTMMIIYVLYFESPSIIPFLFLAYLVAAVYKDIKVLTVISLYFILTILMLLINHGYLFDFQSNPNTNNLVIGLFVFFFLSLLMISTYITLKESQFFYNQISFSKEKELRNINLLIDLKSKIDLEVFHHKIYYNQLRNLFEAFSNKLEINNVFSEKIDILEKLAHGEKKIQILKDHPKIKVEDLNRIEALIVNENSLIRKIAMRIYYFNQKSIHEKEIFSETHFESFNKSIDDMEVKIIIFAIFYVTLKRGLPGVKS